MDLCLGLTAAANYRIPFRLESADKPGIFALIISLFIGFLLGILINYLADVLPATRRLSQPVCPVCKQPYNIKDYSFSLRCPYCYQRRTIRYIVVLISSVSLSVLLRLFPFHGLNFWETLPLFIYIGIIVVIDLEHRLVLIETSLFGIILLLVYGIYFHGFLGALSGALGGMLIMLSFYFFGVIFGKVVGKLRNKTINEVPFGFGDVMFGMILGLLSGWPVIAGAIILGIFIFSAYSLVWLISLIVTKRYNSFSNAQALTPFLILGAIVLFYL